ncbi:hypothetical protein [Streptomyces sp. UH6]|nr:hypothetical protein [Streptomyces sp. UH6]
MTFPTAARDVALLLARVAVGGGRFSVDHLLTGRTRAARHVNG